MTNLGQILLSLPLALSLLQAIKLFSNDKVRIYPSHRTLAQMIFATTLISFVYLISRFVVSDFSYNIVFQNSHTLKPLIYKISGTWGNHEGSMMLFIFILSAYSFFYSVMSKYTLRDTVLGFQAALLFCILAYTYFTSNPFDALPDIYTGATEGLGLNPLLQDIGLAMHPPMLYSGYAGFSIAFSIALSVLKNKITDKKWADYARPWILFSWSVLSIGVMLGSWWAYRELGWGGFWFWDPVENVSLLPWLFSCALIHLILTTKKFNRFPMMALLFCLLTFLSSLLGFFLVRSGVLNSVHTFASDPTRGIAMLAVIFIISSYAMIMFGKRMTEMRFRSEDRLHFLTRQIFMLMMAVLLVAMATTILLGVFWPIVLELFFHETISVGEPYFNAIFIPIALVLVVLAVFAPILKWQKEKLGAIIEKSAFSFALALLITAYVKFKYQQVSIFLEFAMFAGLWLSISAPEVIIRRLLKKEKVSKGFTAMIISHTAFGLLVLAITLVITFESDSQIVARKGEKVKAGDYDLKIDDTEIVKGKNYVAEKVNYIVYKGQDEAAHLSPENRIYFPELTRTHEADIKYELLKDIYVVNGQAEEVAKPADGAGKKIANKKKADAKAPDEKKVANAKIPDNKKTEVAGEKNNDVEYMYPTRVYIKPFISFIWFSVVLMAFGGFLALLPKKK